MQRWGWRQRPGPPGTRRGTLHSTAVLCCGAGGRHMMHTAVMAVCIISRSSTCADSSALFRCSSILLQSQRTSQSWRRGRRRRTPAPARRRRMPATQRRWRTPPRHRQRGRQGRASHARGRESHQRCGPTARRQHQLRTWWNGGAGQAPPRLAGTAKKRHFRNDYSCTQKISPYMYTTDAPNIFNHNSPTFRTFLTDGYICAQTSHTTSSSFSKTTAWHNGSRAAYPRPCWVHVSNRSVGTPRVSTFTKSWMALSSSGRLPITELGGCAEPGRCSSCGCWGGQCSGASRALPRRGTLVPTVTTHACRGSASGPSTSAPYSTSRNLWRYCCPPGYQ
eukprot:COSAG01_NODE_15_length_40797_cov_245.690550_20_plen_335_part_00